MDVACPGNPPFGRNRPPLVAGAGGGEVVVASSVTMRVRSIQGTRVEGAREVRRLGRRAIAPPRRFCRGGGAGGGECCCSGRRIADINTAMACRYEPDGDFPC